MTNYEEMVAEMRKAGLSEWEIEEYIRENYPDN